MPAQCPACGRFLKKDLVESLAAGPAPCPRCGEELDASTFDEAAVGDPSSSGAPPAHAVEEVARVRAEVAGEVVEVRADEPAPAATSAPDARDPLAGWDEDVPTAAAGLGRRREGDLVVALAPEQAAVAAAVGAVLGALVARRRGVGALVGAILAVLGGAIAQALQGARELR